MFRHIQSEIEETRFVEFRRRVKMAHILDPAIEELIRLVQFTGKLTLIIQNGRVLKSGYEEGYFRQQES